VLKRIERFGGAVNAFCLVDPERAPPLRAPD
jgi:hypothetical protein